MSLVSMFKPRVNEELKSRILEAGQSLRTPTAPGTVDKLAVYKFWTPEEQVQRQRAADAYSKVRCLYTAAPAAEIRRALLASIDSDDINDSQIMVYATLPEFLAVFQLTAADTLTPLKSQKCDKAAGWSLFQLWSFFIAGAEAAELQHFFNLRKKMVKNSETLDQAVQSRYAELFLAAVSELPDSASPDIRKQLLLAGPKSETYQKFVVSGCFQTPQEIRSYLSSAVELKPRESSIKRL